MKVVKAPDALPLDAYQKVKVFLAGTIDMGNSVDWQTEVTNSLAAHENVLILNPRRDDWDSSWKQSIDDPQFNQQVTWEMDNITSADVVVFNFTPGSQSPITLLELGLVASQRKSFLELGLKQQSVIVCCPEGFWRKGNVDMVCSRYDITQVNNLRELMMLLNLELAV